MKSLQAVMCYFFKGYELDDLHMGEAAMASDKRKFSYMALGNEILKVKRMV